MVQILLSADLSSWGFYLPHSSSVATYQQCLVSGAQSGWTRDGPTAPAGTALTPRRAAVPYDGPAAGPFLRLALEEGACPVPARRLRPLPAPPGPGAGAATAPPRLRRGTRPAPAPPPRYPPGRVAGGNGPERLRHTGE